VFVDRLDLAVARAIQYARSLTPDDLRAVHFALDPHHAEVLAEQWARLGMSRIALDIADCSDRRITRAAVEAVATDLAGGQTEVTVLLPDRKYKGFWHRILHDQTADSIEKALSELPHANVTTVPFHFSSRRAAKGTGEAVEPAAVATVTGRGEAPSPEWLTENGEPGGMGATRADGTTPIAAVAWRQQVHIEGRVRTVRVQPLAGTSTLECVVEDDTGAMSIVFLGRSKVGGIEVGTRLRAAGVAGQHRGRLAILNPIYTLLR